jgi:membrane-bound inhibitor of C-type lysozyme
MFKTNLVSTVVLTSAAIALSACGSSPKPTPETSVKPVSVVVGANAPAPAPAPASAPVSAPAPIAAPVAAPAPVMAKTPTTSPVPVPAPVASAPVKEFKLETGLYRCEEQQTVAVKRINNAGKSIVIGYKGKDHELAQVITQTGALRYEDAKAGYAWIQVVGSAILLDTKRGSRIANKCVL